MIFDNFSKINSKQSSLNVNDLKLRTQSGAFSSLGGAVNHFFSGVIAPGSPTADDDNVEMARIVNRDRSLIMFMPASTLSDRATTL